MQLRFSGIICTKNKQNIRLDTIKTVGIKML